MITTLSNLPQHFLLNFITVTFILLFIAAILSFGWFTIGCIIIYRCEDHDKAHFHKQRRRALFSLCLVILFCGIGGIQDYRNTNKLPDPSVPVFIDEQPYGVRILTGGFWTSNTSLDHLNDWDIILDTLGEDNELLHYETMASWCQEYYKAGARWAHIYLRVIRAGQNARTWNFTSPSKAFDFVGYRPVLVPLNVDTLKPDPRSIVGLQDGTVLTFGTLYMDGEALKNPQAPTKNGDIPDYVAGAQLHLGDSSPVPGTQIHWIKCGDILIADRNILKNISWNDLHRQGLVFGTGTENANDQISFHPDDQYFIEVN